MRSSVLDYLNFYRLPTGRRLMALMRLKEGLDGRADFAKVAAIIDQAIAHDEPLFEKEMLWRARRNKDAEHGAEARKLDRRLDKLLGAIDASLEAQIRLGTAQAEAMQKELFPEGVKALIHGRYIDQAHGTRRLLKRLDENADYRKLAARIGLEDAFDELRQTNVAYTAALNTAVAPPSLEELKAAREVGHRRFGEIIAQILGRYPGDDNEDRRQRAALLEPVERQNERLRRLYRERRRGRNEDDLGSDDDPGLDLGSEAAEAAEAA